MRKTLASLLLSMVGSVAGAQTFAPAKVAYAATDPTTFTCSKGDFWINITNSHLWGCDISMTTPLWTDLSAAAGGGGLSFPLSAPVSTGVTAVAEGCGSSAPYSFAGHVGDGVCYFVDPGKSGSGISSTALANTMRLYVSSRVNGTLGDGSFAQLDVDPGGSSFSAVRAVAARGSIAAQSLTFRLDPERFTAYTSTTTGAHAVFSVATAGGDYLTNTNSGATLSSALRATPSLVRSSVLVSGFVTTEVSQSDTETETIVLAGTSESHFNVAVTGPRVTSVGAQPTCDSSLIGRMWRTVGAPGVADAFEICLKDSTDTYAWRSLVGILP